MSRHSEALSEANCDTLDAWYDAREKEERWWEAQNKDQNWIDKQMSNGSHNTVNERK